MKIVIVLILALVMAPALGMAGGSILMLWDAGIELQPLWVRITNYLVLVLLARLLLTRFYSKSGVKVSFRRFVPAIIGLIIMPVNMGLLSSDFFDFGEGDSPIINIQTLMDGLLPYLSLPLNLMFLIEEGVKPFIARQHQKSKLS